MLYSSLGAGAVRLILRIITIVMFFLIPVLGDRCCRLRNQLKLLRNQNVTITSMTGWIKGPSAISAAWKMRKLPAGFFGLLMILAASLALVTDLLVAKLVNTVGFQDRCPFEGGMVADGSLGIAVYPPVNSKAYTMASSAQLNSYANGGYYGVYTKVNNDTSFAAEASDTIGYWQCNLLGTPQTYNSSALWDYEIAQDMISKNLLYPNWNFGNTTNVNVTTHRVFQTSWQLLVMSISADQPGTPFKIRMAVDNVDRLDPVTHYPIEKTMQAYDCYLDAYPAFNATASKILSGIDPMYLLGNWIEPIRGNLYESLYDFTVGEDPQLWINWFLNSATMIAGSYTSTTSTFPGSYYGCIIAITEIPSVVVVFVALSGLFAVVLSLTAIVLLIMVWRAGKKYDNENNGSRLSSKELKESVPNGLVGWMVHAAQEANRAPERPDERGLTEWRLTAKDFDNHRLKMVRAHAVGEAENMIQRPEQRIHSNPHVYNGQSYSQNENGFFGQKTGYSSVNTRDLH